MHKGAALFRPVGILRPPRKITRSSSPEWRRELRAFLPGSEIAFLLRRELVQSVSHRIELEARDFLIQILRHDIHLRLEILVVRAKVFGGQRLVGEAHVHYRSGMSLGG